MRSIVRRPTPPPLLLCLASAVVSCVDAPPVETATTTRGICDGVSSCPTAFRHWRSIGPARMTTPTPGGTCSDAATAQLAWSDGAYAAWIACSNGETCTTPTDLHFPVPDYAAVSEAVFTLETMASGPDASATIGCLGAGGVLVPMVPLRNYPTGEATYRAELPLACLGGPDVVVRISRVGSNCLGPDAVSLAVKSEYRRVPIDSVTSPGGTCGEACVAGLGEDDGTNLPWIACSSAYAYDTPTDLHFRVFDHAQVTSANLTLDTAASGADARANITCVSPSGTLLATLVPTTLFSPAQSRHTWSVPSACFTSSEVIIRVTRVGANCLGPDFVALDVQSTARAAYVAAIPQTGTCTSGAYAGCLADLDANDGSYFTQWMACSSSYGFSTPTDLAFATPEWASVQTAWVVVDTVASGSDARVSVSCVDGAGAQLASILPTTLFPTYAKTYSWPVPAACFTGPTTRIRFTRVGGNCLGPDFVRLYLTSSGANGLVRNVGALEGYTTESSYAPGETLDLRVHAPGGSFSASIIRYGAAETTMDTLGTLAGARQDHPEDAYRLGAGWPSSHTYVIPSTFPSGLYAVRLTDGTTTTYVTFVVREAAPGAGAIGLLASTNTWDAYNSWGGKSEYQYQPPDESRRTVAPFLTTQRPRLSASPYERSGHTAGAERYFNEWLEARGYGYGELADLDFHASPSLLGNYRAVIVSTHSEYWTKEMYDAARDYLARGGNLLYLSGNGVYWKTSAVGDVLEVRKDGTAHAQTGERGGLWRDLGRPESGLVGVQYDGNFWCVGSVSQPYSVLEPASWAFDGTGAGVGTLVGATGAPGACGTGAAGWEIDRMGSGTPVNAVRLGVGAGSAPADMVYFDHPGGGGVFAVGSINWGRSLSDPAIDRITRNVLDRFTQGWRRAPITAITAPSGTCTTGCALELNQDDGHYLDYTSATPWVACSGAYGYDTPTDLHFPVFDAAFVTAAELTLDTTASGSDARATISCLSPSGATLATILPSTLFPASPARYRWSVPTACFSAGPEAIIRVARTGANCLGPDWVSLAVRSSARVRPIEAITSPTSCASGADCVRRMNLDDRDYLTWVACASPPGPNGPTEYASPTDLHFSVSSPAAVTSAQLLVDLYGSGPDAQVRFECVNGAGAVLATIAPTQAWSTLARVYALTVPTACFASSDVVVRMTRSGSNCLGMDFARLVVRP